MAPSYQTIENTIKGFMQGYVEASRTKNMQLLSSHVTDDCQRSVGPASFLASVGAPPGFTMGNDDYAAEFNGMTLYEFENHTIYRQVIDTQNLKAAAVTEIFVKFNDGGKSSRNFVWFLDFAEDGSKVKNIWMQVDPEEAINWFKDVKARKEALKQ